MMMRQQEHILQRTAVHVAFSATNKSIGSALLTPLKPYAGVDINTYINGSIITTNRKYDTNKMQAPTFFCDTLCNWIVV